MNFAFDNGFCQRYSERLTNQMSAPDQLSPVPDVLGWRLDHETRAAIDRILAETITDPGPEFMAPPARGRS